jgi:hypothetical protein
MAWMSRTGGCSHAKQLVWHYFPPSRGLEALSGLASSVKTVVIAPVRPSPTWTRKQRIFFLFLILILVSLFTLANNDDWWLINHRVIFFCMSELPSLARNKPFHNAWLGSATVNDSSRQCYCQRRQRHRQQYHLSTAKVNSVMHDLASTSRHGQVTSVVSSRARHGIDITSRPSRLSSIITSMARRIGAYFPD